MAFTLKSSVISDGGTIPPLYTCDGRNISPPLQWEDPPAGTAEFALLVEDPDAPHGVFTHWVLYGLLPEANSLPENVMPGADGPNGSKQGKNSGQQVGYTGPCPPEGTHRYVFNLYALDGALDLPAGVTKTELYEAMGGQIIAEVQLECTYRKRPPAIEAKGSAKGNDGAGDL